MSAAQQQNQAHSQRPEPVIESVDGWNSFSLLLPPTMRDEISEAYAGRVFTNLARLGGMWETWLLVGGDPGDRAMIYAIAYHALVGADDRSQNPSRSAAHFGSRADLMGLDRAIASDAIDMILSQMRPLEMVQPRCIIFSDIKLSFLAASPDAFRAAVEAANTEGRWTCDCFQYLAGRKIFRSGVTPAHWELRAQANVMTALADAA